MLQKLLIQNFQRHKKLEVIFDPHITTIIGQNDVGKSAVVRAIQWLATNRPSGEEFIKWGANQCIVRLKVDGKIVTRSRTQKSGNCYRLGKQTYKAFGANIPGPIQRLLNLGEHNFQQQHDAPFWFTETPTNASRKLNTIFNLGLIDRSLAKVAADARKEALALTICQDRRKAAKTAKTTLAYAPALAKAAQQLQTHQTDYANTSAQLTVLHTTIGQAAEALLVVQHARRIASVAHAAITTGRSASEVANQHNKLEAAINRCLLLQETAASKPPQSKHLDTLYTTAHQAHSRVSRLCHYVVQAENATLVFTAMHIAAKAAITKLKKVQVCPTCQRPL